MKYYLVIGYCLTEKHKEYPTVTVHINGNLIEQFIADNESTKEISTTYTNQQHTTDLGTYSLYRNQDLTFNFGTTVKHKILEVDTSDWTSEGEITIEVSNNNSDYNNGFVSKRSIITLQPIILINKELFHNKNAMQRIFKKLVFAEEVVLTPLAFLKKASSDSKEVDFIKKVRDEYPDDDTAKAIKKVTIANNRSRMRWPGFTEYTPHSESLVALTRGGNFQLKLKILRKHKTFFITTDQWRPSGFFFTEHFFLAWYQHFSKDFFKITIDQHHDKATDKNRVKVDTNEVTLKK